MQAQLGAIRNSEPYRVHVAKPWGGEILWAETPYYCGKILHILSGRRLSLQYHDEKVETLCLLGGRALLIIEDGAGVLREIEMEPGKGYTVLPFQRHRLAGIEDAVIVEVSTCETGTTFRLEDDYSRPHETPEVRRTRGVSEQ